MIPICYVLGKPDGTNGVPDVEGGKKGNELGISGHARNEGDNSGNSCEEDSSECDQSGESEHTNKNSLISITQVVMDFYSADLSTLFE